MVDYSAIKALVSVFLMGIGGCVAGYSASRTGPVAIATAVATAPVNTTIILDGSRSSDTTGRTLNYRWMQNSGPANVIIQNSLAAVATFMPTVVGTYTFLLIVTDAQGLSSSDMISVTVTVGGGAENTLIARAVAPLTAQPNAAITLNAASSTSTGGQIVSFLWEQTSGPTSVLIENPNLAVTTVLLQDPGIYTFQVTVRDSNNLVSTASATVAVGSSAQTVF